tara:strand:+ start:383 stop:625 length:243 start_codon:yes stop_codon:yes gene_type:complete
MGKKDFDRCFNFFPFNQVVSIYFIEQTINQKPFSEILRPFFVFIAPGAKLVENFSGLKPDFVIQDFKSISRKAHRIGSLL